MAWRSRPQRVSAHHRPAWPRASAPEGGSHVKSSQAGWLKLLGVLVLAVALIGTGRYAVALAKPGDLIAEVTTIEGFGPTWPRGISVSVGFDGQYLYYTEYGGSILHRINVPPAGAATPATGQVDVPITGAPSGLRTIAYAARRHLFWA